MAIIKCEDKSCVHNVSSLCPLDEVRLNSDSCCESKEQE